MQGREYFVGSVAILVKLDPYYPSVCSYIFMYLCRTKQHQTSEQGAYFAFSFVFLLKTLNWLKLRPIFIPYSHYLDWSLKNVSNPGYLFVFVWGSFLLRRSPHLPE